MRIIGNRAGRPRTRAAQHEENLNTRPGDPGRLGARTETERVLELDQEQARVALAALEDAATLRREAISNCPDCRSAGERVCTDHEGSWEAAEGYDSLRWHLDNSYRDGQADQEEEAATAPAPTEYLDPREPAVPDTSRGVSPEVYNAIADYAREANRPKHGADGEPYISLEEEAALAESPGESQAHPRQAEDQIIASNEANDHRNEASNYEADREPGE